MSVGDGPVTAPAAPSNLTATGVSTSEIDLAWQNNASNATYFQLQRATDSAFTRNVVTLRPPPTPRAMRITLDMVTGTTYYYRVLPATAAGDSAMSNTAIATTSAPTAPAVPSNLAATAALQSQINLTWTDNSNNETGFKIDQATSSRLHPEPDHGDGRRQRDDLQRHRSVGSTTYYYRVRATNGAGDSANTSTASATTGAPGTPVAVPVPDGNFADTAGYYINSNTGGGRTFTSPMTARFPAGA